MIARLFFLLFLSSHFPSTFLLQLSWWRKMKKLFLGVWQWGQWKALHEIFQPLGDSTRKNICTVPKQTFISRLSFNALWRSRKKFNAVRVANQSPHHWLCGRSLAARAVHLQGKDVGNLFRHMFSYIIEFTAIKSSGRSTCETREKICSPNNTHSLSMNASVLRNSNSVWKTGIKLRLIITSATFNWWQSLLPFSHPYITRVDLQLRRKKVFPSMCGRDESIFCWVALSSREKIKLTRLS